MGGFERGRLLGSRAERCPASGSAAAERTYSQVLYRTYCAASCSPARRTQTGNVEKARRTARQELLHTRRSGGEESCSKWGARVEGRFSEVDGWMDATDASVGGRFKEWKGRA
jgi:hypothetical protein